MKRSWIRFAGLSALSLGVLMLAATGFLTYWQFASGAQHDIAARGAIVLFLLLPEILLVTAIIVIAISATLLRRSGLGWWRIMGITLAAFAVAALVEFSPPLFLMPRALALIPPSFRPAADFMLASVLAFAGATVVRRASSPRLHDAL